MSLTFHLPLLITMTTCHRTLNKIFIRSRGRSPESEPIGTRLVRRWSSLISGIFLLTSLHLPVFHRGNGHLLWHLFDVFGFRCGSHWESGKTFCWFQSIQVTTRWAQPRPHGLHWNFKFKWVSEHRNKRVKCVCTYRTPWALFPLRRTNSCIAIFFVLCWLVFSSTMFVLNSNRLFDIAMDPNTVDFSRF